MPAAAAAPAPRPLPAGPAQLRDAGRRRGRSPQEGRRAGADAGAAELPGMSLEEPGRTAHGAGLCFFLPPRPPCPRPPRPQREQHRLAGPRRASGMPAQSRAAPARPRQPGSPRPHRSSEHVLHFNPDECVSSHHCQVQVSCGLCVAPLRRGRGGLGQGSGCTLENPPREQGAPCSLRISP